MNTEWRYTCEMEVRDCELDAQGVVNNAVYQNYLEHCRHKYIRSLGIDFIDMHNQGYDLMVSKITLNYKAPLTSFDHFIVKAKARRSGRLRIIVDQEIRKIADDQIILTAEVEVICFDIKKKRPCMPEILKQVFENI